VRDKRQPFAANAIAGGVTRVCEPHDANESGR
jgi:hypothetical protein